MQAQAITTPTNHSPAPTSAPAKGLCVFLAHYAARLLGCGATCIRLEKNVKRIARAYGFGAELTIMPRHVNVTIEAHGGSEVFTSMAAVGGEGIDFDLNTRLSRLSWRIADQHYTLHRARRLYRRLCHPRSQDPWGVAALVGAANAAFCRLFGGDTGAMAVVFAATLAGFVLKQLLQERHVDNRLAVTLCAFVSAVLAASALLFGIGQTPSVAMATSVLYLVPGIPFINSFSDMLYRHYICAFSRFVDALVLTCCLSIGLCAAMAAMKVGMF